VRVDACRSCGSESLAVFLTLGETPLANALLRQEDLARPEARFPLDVALCADCSLVQILDTVPPEVMFSEYPYLSSVSTTMVAHARALAERTIADERLGPASLVVEAASNDGYLLQWYRARGISVLGIEPARNVAAVAREKGVETECAFFGSATAKAREHQADVFHAHNVLAHVPAVNDFVAGIGVALKPSGLGIVEVPYVVDLVDRVEFDTIYHEHLSYFSLTALCRLFERHALAVTDVAHLPIHGGTLRIHVRHAGHRSPSPTVAAMLADERARGVDALAFYADFSRRVERLRTDLVAMLTGLKAKGCSISAYGASAKGSTLLNAFGIGRELLDCVVDRSPVKQGRYTPGTHLPIVGPDRLARERPDYLLLLVWNFADEVLAQQADYRRAGGRFIIPVPTPRIV